jgi:Domain of unknown function (DUF6089)
VKKLLLILSVLFSFTCIAQQSTIDFIGGLANYQGDLQSKRYTFQLAKSAYGIGGSHQLGAQLSVRGSLIFAKIEGDDKYQKDKQLRIRNLRFYSNITEFNINLQYNLMDIHVKKYTPYVFLGVGVFKFDPYIYDHLDNKVYLKPLSTEGQGLPQYPSRKYYKTIDLAIPFGAGFTYSLNEKINVGIELGARKLYTDYLDDVSKTYADYFPLKEGRGFYATTVSFRSNQIPEGANVPYPNFGTKRGSPRHKDWYYLTTFTVSYKFGKEPFSKGTGNGSVGKRFRRGTSCPKPRY